MTKEEILEVFNTKKEFIINNTLDQIPNAMRGDLVNRSFYIDKDGNVEYSIYLGQIQLDDTYFFTINGYDTLECGDFGYDTNDEMLEDGSFIDDIYRDEIELAIEQAKIFLYVNTEPELEF